MPAPYGNTNAANKRKAKPRISVSMAISGTLRESFEAYLSEQGIVATEANIKQLARQWGYDEWRRRMSEQQVVS
jgi:predicted hydrolase (HD superfamily)